MYSCLEYSKLFLFACLANSTLALVIFSACVDIPFSHPFILAIMKLLLWSVFLLVTVVLVFGNEDETSLQTREAAEEDTNALADASGSDETPTSAAEKTEKLLKASKTLATIAAILVGLASGPAGAAISIGNLAAFIIISLSLEQFHGFSIPY